MLFFVDNVIDRSLDKAVNDRTWGLIWRGVIVVMMMMANKGNTKNSPIIEETQYLWFVCFCISKEVVWDDGSVNC